MKIGRVYKAIAAILFTFISIAVVLIIQNPSPGYEISVYTALPPLVWVLLATAIAGGISIVVYEASRSGKNGNWWLLGLSIILLSNLVIVLLPILRGYLFNIRVDHPIHLGIVKDILLTGRFPSGIVYPVTHILVAQASSILNISLTTAMNLTGPIFYLLFVLFTYLLCQAILSRPATILATTASTVLFIFYYTEVFPQGFAFITFPFFFYFYFKPQRETSVSLTFILILLVFQMVFFHVVSAFMLILAMVTMELVKPLFARLYNGKRGLTFSTPSSIRPSLNLPIMGLIVLLFWVWGNFDVWQGSVLSVASWFRDELLATPLTEIAWQSFRKLGLNLISQLGLFIKMYGHTFIYLVLSLMAVTMVMRKRAFPFVRDLRGVFLFSGFFLLAAAVWLVDYVRPLTSLHSGRIIHLVIALFPPLVGLALCRMVRVPAKNISGPGNGKLAWRITAATIVIVASLIGIFSIYPSPFIYQFNSMTNHAELEGVYWLLERKNPDIRVLSAGMEETRRYAQTLWGYEVSSHLRADYYPSEHFGYIQYRTIGEAVGGDGLMILRSEFLKSVYSGVWAKVDRFNEDDFRQLEMDISADKLYDNGEVDVWYVHGQDSAK